MAPDLVISTHPVATAIVDFLKHRRKLKMPLWVAFSDWHFQRFWTFPNVDHYFVPVEGQREELKRTGVCRDNVSVVGMLLSADYYGPNRSKARARAKLRLDSNASIVLILGGGTGWALETIISGVREMDHTFVVVAGSENRQKELQEYMSKFTFRGKWKVLSWVHTLPFLVAADVVIAKPGGLTTAEALHLKKALILCSAIPGHEEQNARVLREMGVPWALKPNHLPHLIKEVLEKRNRTAHAARSHAGPYFLSTTTPGYIADALEEVLFSKRNKHQRLS